MLQWLAFIFIFICFLFFFFKQTYIYFKECKSSVVPTAVAKEIPPHALTPGCGSKDETLHTFLSLSSTKRMFVEFRKVQLVLAQYAVKSRTSAMATALEHSRSLAHSKQTRAWIKPANCTSCLRVWGA